MRTVIVLSALSETTTPWRTFGLPGAVLGVVGGGPIGWARRGAWPPSHAALARARRGALRPCWRGVPRRARPRRSSGGCGGAASAAGRLRASSLPRLLRLWARPRPRRPAPRSAGASARLGSAGPASGQAAPRRSSAASASGVRGLRGASWPQARPRSRCSLRSRLAIRSAQLGLRCRCRARARRSARARGRAWRRAARRCSRARRSRAGSAGRTAPGARSDVLEEHVVGHVVDLLGFMVG